MACRGVDHRDVVAALVDNVSKPSIWRPYNVPGILSDRDSSNDLKGIGVDLGDGVGVVIYVQTRTRSRALAPSSMLRPAIIVPSALLLLPLGACLITESQRPAHKPPHVESLSAPTELLLTSRFVTNRQTSLLRHRDAAPLARTCSQEEAPSRPRRRARAYRRGGRLRQRRVARRSAPRPCPWGASWRQWRSRRSRQSRVRPLLGTKRRYFL